MLEVLDLIEPTKSFKLLAMIRLGHAFVSAYIHGHWNGPQRLE